MRANRGAQFGEQHIVRVHAQRDGRADVDVGYQIVQPPSTTSDWPV